MEYGQTKDKLVNCGAFARSTMIWGKLAASENEEAAMELMELFNRLLIVDYSRSLLNQDEVCKCIEAVFFMLRQWPNSLRLRMRAYNNLMWTCQKYRYYENRKRESFSACLVMRKLNYYLRAEADNLLERAGWLLSKKDRKSVKLTVRCALAKPSFRMDFMDLRTAHLDLIAAERKDSVAILTLAIWKSKIAEMFAEEPYAKRPKTRSHIRTTRHIAWWHCQSDVILSNVLPFLPPLDDYRGLPG
jgi:hypothetical protein